jgi:hypothetical protein
LASAHSHVQCEAGEADDEGKTIAVALLADLNVDGDLLGEAQ